MLKSSTPASEKSSFQMKRRENAPLPLNNQERTSSFYFHWTFLDHIQSLLEKVTKELCGIS